MKRLLRSWGTILFVALSFFLATPALADWTVTVTTVDGKIVTIESPICREGQVLVPVRDLAEALGAGIDYSLIDQSVRIIAAPPERPARVCAAPFPARVALTNNGHLWLVDGGRAASAPVQITREGHVEILGWSADGQWLMYLAKPYLWVVKADGTETFQVDPKPVCNTLDGSVPAWSPKANIIAYSTQSSGDDYARDGNLKVAFLGDGGNGQTTVSKLLPDGSGVDDFAWAPDGQSIVYSLPRTGEHALLINRITLDGEVSNLITEGEAGSGGAEECLTARSAGGFRWSPDGRYLAYYLVPGSASLAADGVAIRVLDLEKSGRPLELGPGLQYPQWLAWSPDSSRLAYIVGYGRDATVYKHLCLADMRSGGEITDCGSIGQADTQPVWSPDEPSTLLFCRGLENDWWSDFKGGVLVPGQRIRQLTDTEEVKSVTSGPAETADYAPMVSPDGKSLLYLRLNRCDSGSLYLKPLAGGPEVELIHGLTGGHGYYGNYYPAWVSVYWRAQ